MLPGAPDLPIPVLDRIILPDAQPGETRGDHEEYGDPLSLCQLFLSSEERLVRSSVDAFLSGETGVISHR